MAYELNTYSWPPKPYPEFTERRKLEAEKARIEQRLAVIAQRGEDEYDDGAVIQFVKKYGKYGKATTYTFVAIKAGGRWWATDVSSPSNGRSWEQLADFIYDRNTVDPEIHYMTAMEAA